MIYLDNNATTRIAPAVLQAMASVWERGPLNPSSQHAQGRIARSILDQALAQIGRLLGADIEKPGGPQLILTSGGTEANQLAMCGFGDSHRPLVVSAIEHPSILEMAKIWKAEGREVTFLPVDKHGVVSLESLQQTLEHRSGESPLVCLMAANNETGVLQPIFKAAQLCRAAKAHLHVDATQAIGKIPFDFTALEIDSLVFAPHKFHGPAGIGGLLIAPHIPFKAIWRGGAQQLGMRPGTESVPLAVGAASALQLACDSLHQMQAEIQPLRDSFEQQLQNAIPGLVIHGGLAERLATTSCLGFPHIDRQSMLMGLDMNGVCCSSGSACASGSSEPSYVLQAMDVAAETLQGSLRFGLSKFSTPVEINDASDRIINCFNRLRP
ncbi:Cysteine desulfurase [Roseimaritima multifibrata]|uniref:Cysteine desulfurase n=1 Tax=Roseimaritima multifibrata TaxID=1930274 RepID=A0A517MPD9_9BACT|nr:cysteine desulfurase family protein [Roseimaritima multifibrata]QDS96742.1 Cysteine desulfurase [Roseimaritima multifibrata]